VRSSSVSRDRGRNAIAACELGIRISEFGPGAGRINRRLIIAKQALRLAIVFPENSVRCVKAFGGALGRQPANRRRVAPHLSSIPFQALHHVAGAPLDESIGALREAAATLQAEDSCAQAARAAVVHRESGQG
jgi:hypothetical protein